MFQVNIYIFGLKKCTTYCKKGSCSAKNLGQSDDAKQRKKGDVHSPTVLIHFTSL